MERPERREDDRVQRNVDMNSVVETLVTMFGNVMTKEVICTVAESCEGDLNVAAEALMNMTSDNSPVKPAKSIEDTSENSVIMNDKVITSRDKPLNNLRVESSSALVPLVYVPEIPSTSLGQFQQQGQKIYENTASPSSSNNLNKTQLSFAGIFKNSASMKDTTDSQSNSSSCSSDSLATTPWSTGAVPKQPKNTIFKDKLWDDQMRSIINQHNQGSRILIILRGAPGSGKSHMARQIVEMTIGAKPSDFLRHIYSTDDYFLVRGHYRFDKFRLSEAHEWNKNRVRSALTQGISPIFVDNTNIELWEMEPYVRDGVLNGYIIEVLEPRTPWAKKASLLVKKNVHNVPIENIRRMLGNFREGFTGNDLIAAYGFSYPPDKTPPVLRNIPEVKKYHNQPNVVCENYELNKPDTISTTYNELREMQQKLSGEESNACSLMTNEIKQSLNEVKSSASSLTNEVKQTSGDVNHSDEEERQKKVLEMQKRLEEIERVEQEWENGETWDEEVSQETTSSYDTIKTTDNGPKPPRKNISDECSPRSKCQDDLQETVKKCNDWTRISMFMPPWMKESSSEIEREIPVNCIVTQTASTCVEIGDTDLKNPKKNFKVITTTPRDINIFHLPLQPEKIPQNRMLDKSSMTNELLLTEAYRCKNEEQHFVAFRKLFKNIPKDDLRDIFDKCCGDVNWAVDIVLDGMANKELKTVDDEDLSETEELSVEQCDCVAAYQVIPDIKTTSTQPKLLAEVTEVPKSPVVDHNTCQSSAKKTKAAPSESSLQLKRHIEQNIVIADDHYSKHCLKIRKMRRGEVDSDNEQSNEASGDQTPNEANGLNGENKSDDESVLSSDEAERTININLGMDFITQLDNLFGRKGMTYPKNIKPRINIPISLLNEINAFWMESLMHQFDGLEKQSEQMVLEDAEFARQLEIKEAELASSGKEPEVPDFKEIMDMDLAMSLYQKDIAEWRNKEPNDIAAKMTRDKLYNLFPDMSHDILSELLMAHDNNFKATVEVLLMSTGKTEILLEKNGLNKFVMKKEMERHEKLLEEEKKAISEFEWPPLPQGEKIDMADVNRYRLQAEKHLVHRNIHVQKAQDYIRRGMTQVANYYSDVANFHKQKYEQANSMAAVTLAQVHASNSPDNATIDLHYLRVGEAKESLDIFLDTHIQKLKDANYEGPRFQTLFFITGRGLHSQGKPKVKPAVKKRLTERGLVCVERNPGLLTARVCANDMLSYQVPQQA